MSTSNPPSSGPDWGVIGGALTAIATAVTAYIAATSKKPNGRNLNDLTLVTLDSVFKLVSQLQDEVTRTTARAQELETNNAQQAKTITELRAEISSMKKKTEGYEF